MAKSEVSQSIGLIVMGPCACGKSEVGLKLSEYYKCPFLDGDDFHTEENVWKMQNGIPLTDEDRIPWLKRLRKEMINFHENPQESSYGDHSKVKNSIRIVASCSALKKSYRNILRGKGEETKNDFKILFVFLDCSRPVLEQRLNERKGHFMKAGMLDSQLNTLERPDKDEILDFVTVNGDLELKLLISDIVHCTSVRINRVIQ